MTSSRVRWIVLGLLVPIHGLLLGWLACCYSPTSDEVAHLAAGVRLWRQGEFDLYAVNPPLVKAVASWPVVLAPPWEDWRHLDSRPGARPEWLVGMDLLKANTPRFRWDFVMARWMCLPFSILGLLYCFRWSEELFGPAGGLLSASLWCFSPNILGNAALITPDVPATALGVAACFHFRRWWQTGRWRDALLAGVVLGLAELTKMTWLLLYGVLPVLWGILEWQRKEPSSTGRRAGQLGFLLFISLDVLNAGYLFDRSLQPLKEFEFTSELLSGHRQPAGTGNRFKDSWLGALPVPVPAAYLVGFDLQRRDFESGALISYLRGELRQGGWWYYYLYGLLIKVPLGTGLILLCCIRSKSAPGANRSLRNESIPPDSPASKERCPQHSTSEWLLLLVPSLCLFVFVSSQTGFSRYVRYVLPVLPFLWVTLGAAWGNGSTGWRRGMAGLGLLMSLGASLAAYPHSLSFFNLLAGGPSRGHWHLLDSNVDWGQDLYFLHDWIRQHPQATPLTLACAGVMDPQLLGIPGRPLSDSSIGRDGAPVPGWYAVSVNHLHGYDQAPPLCTWFLEKTPVARAGNSIFIYHVPEEEETR